MQLTWVAFFLARASAGNNSAARMGMIAITTRSSIKVKPRPLTDLPSERSCYINFLSCALPFREPTPLQDSLGS